MCCENRVANKALEKLLVNFMFYNKTRACCSVMKKYYPKENQAAKKTVIRIEPSEAYNINDCLSSFEDDLWQYFDHVTRTYDDGNILMANA